MNKKLEETANKLEIMRNTLKFYENHGWMPVTNIREVTDSRNAIDIVLNYIKNSIPKQIVEKKQNELQKEYKEALEENSIKAFILKCKLEMIKELLEEK